MRATTAQLYRGRDTFEFDQGRVTKNQPITVLILLSESEHACKTSAHAQGLFSNWRLRMRTSQQECLSLS